MENSVANSRQIAQYLLEIKAVVLQPENPFTWASGWKSPIYCDNRLILSYPKIREAVRNAFAQMSKELKFDRIAGVATGGIAHAAFVAEALNMPMCYVRSSKKGHGRQNQVEGVAEAGDKILVIEDLVSTGGSSLQAVDALREKGVDVVGLYSVFTYGFQQAADAFENANVYYKALTNYNDLLSVAIEQGYIKEDLLPELEAWRNAPHVWRQ
ncbi:MAG: orotate phosphoribosyltransferase [Bacteroidetes bacterium]|nr:orotate phosphoribosyltransferase [Bacteroidota bacterium]